MMHPNALKIGFETNTKIQKRSGAQALPKTGVQNCESLTSQLD